MNQIQKATTMDAQNNPQGVGICSAGISWSENTTEAVTKGGRNGEGARNKVSYVHSASGQYLQCKEFGTVRLCLSDRDRKIWWFKKKNHV